MGGDFAPANVIAGAVEAVVETRGRFTVILVGPEDRLNADLERSFHGSGSADLRRFCVVVPATEVITMEDSPTAALKTKKDSSIAIGVTLHHDGKAEAFVSAGNTGAVLSASTLILGRVEGVGRPTIGTLFPTASAPCLLVDAGTNVDCRPRHLLEFGVMGSTYVSAMLGTPRPKVGLLSIGEEDSKGNEASLEALALLRASTLNFIGNIEGRDILAGRADVVVCDGFVGNILLKFGESVPAFLKSRLMTFASKSLWNRLLILPARSGLRSVLRDLDYQEQGGVPLLGVNGVSIIGHGGSTPKAIKNMIYRAEEMVRHRVHLLIREAMIQTVS
jgi:glycerol-3-phosphate acyltransferase PlsX